MTYNVVSGTLDPTQSPHLGSRNSVRLSVRLSIRPSVRLSRVLCD